MLKDHFVTLTSSIPILSATGRFYLHNRAATERDKACFARGRVLCPTSNALFVRLSIFGREEIFLRTPPRRLVRRIGDKRKSLLPKSTQSRLGKAAYLTFDRR